MSNLVPFDQCVARPEKNGKVFLLQDHLLGVKDAIEKRLVGNTPLTIKLAGAAGFCHDVAKANCDWQSYIKGKRKQGPNHAPEGAFLFSYWGYHLLKLEGKWKDYAVLWLWLTRDIADHHGPLKALSENRWIGAGAWDKIDLRGLMEFTYEVYPELEPIAISQDKLEQWAEDVYDIFDDAIDLLDLGFQYVSPDKLMTRLAFWRELTTSLIVGDRFNVTPTETTWLEEEEHLAHEQAIDAHCHEQNDQALAKVRMDAQFQIMKQLREAPNERIYSLEMPTGYGKTVTALKIATWLGLNQGYKKIVYVAPYLSILEQTSKVIEDTMNTMVLEHHSLAILDRDNNHSDEEELSSRQLMMESWANSIVCTSFQQWSKALFPARAQDVLRRAYLRDCVVIIDEPQIFAPEGWNVFLCGLEAIAELYNLRILFLSATMPPFDFGLLKQPTNLCVTPVEHVERYRVVQIGEKDEEELVQFILSREEKSKAAILNTIKDAYLVYKGLIDKTPNLMLLHGMMVPLHKRVEIEKIRHHQKYYQEEPLCVISTQIIEAGVDLSFGHIIRALPLLPSIVQAAGRVNRHSEAGSMGTVSLVLFLREGKTNTRNFIYTSAFLRKLTDELLSQKEVWLESEILELVKEYYRKMFDHNSFESGKEGIREAYEGNWPELAKFQPFEEGYFKLPVFVPWHVPDCDKKFLPKKFVELCCRFNIHSPDILYERYQDPGYYLDLSFQERKEFMILFNHYVVNVPAKLAFSLVGKEAYENNRIPVIGGVEEYDPIAGLAKRAVEGFDNFI